LEEYEMPASTVYGKSQAMVFRKIEDEIILVPIRNNVGDLQSIYTLNEVAGRIWELLDGKNSEADIVNVLTSEFEVTPEQARADVADFLRELEHVGAIVRV